MVLHSGDLGAGRRPACQCLGLPLSSCIIIQTFSGNLRRHSRREWVAAVYMAIVAEGKAGAIYVRVSDCICIRTKPLKSDCWLLSGKKTGRKQRPFHKLLRVEQASGVLCLSCNGESFLPLFSRALCKNFALPLLLLPGSHQWKSTEKTELWLWLPREIYYIPSQPAM